MEKRRWTSGSQRKGSKSVKLAICLSLTTDYFQGAVPLAGRPVSEGETILLGKSDICDIRQDAYDRPAGHALHHIEAGPEYIDVAPELVDDEPLDAPSVPSQ